MTLAQWVAPPQKPWTRTMCGLSVMRCSLCWANGRRSGRLSASAASRGGRRRWVPRRRSGPTTSLTRRQRDPNPRNHVVVGLNGWKRQPHRGRFDRYRRLVLLGREAERAAIERVVDAARSGRAGALVLRGE